MSGSRFRSLPRFIALDGQPTTDALGEHINLLASALEQNILEIDRAISTDDIDTDTGFSLSGVDADIDITSIDIVGGTAFDNSKANVADADLFIFNDGASDNAETVKIPASDIKTYMSSLTLTTAAQTAITSVGTLSGLTVTASGTAAKLQYTGSSGNPCVTLDQDDVDAPFIEFDGTAGAANTNSVVTTTGNVSGGINRFVKVKQGGTTYYLPLYAAS